MRTWLLPIAIATVSISSVASAQDAQPAPVLTVSPPSDANDSAKPEATKRDPSSDVPHVTYTIQAFGAPEHTLGALGYGGVLAGTVEKTQPMGGARVWGSPIDRVTLFAEGYRKEFGDFAPTVYGVVRFAGSRDRGWAFAGSVAYKADGFADLGGEVEGGFLLSAVTRGGLHLDTNFVFGGGFEESEADAELKTRVGYDVSSFMRVGLDGRFRVRVAGQAKLRGDRYGDLIGGPEIMLGKDRFFVDFLAGPTTVGIVKGVGFAGTGTLGILVL